MPLKFVNIIVKSLPPPNNTKIILEKEINGIRTMFLDFVFLSLLTVTKDRAPQRTDEFEWLM